MGNSYIPPLLLASLGQSSHTPHFGQGLQQAAFGQSFPATFLGQSLPYRSRIDWNARFAHWERSESDSETKRIERARDMVHAALELDSWFADQGIKIVPQGSFTNRTNTRLEADIDLRVEHPMLKVEYDATVDAAQAWTAGGYYSTGVTFDDVMKAMRSRLGTTLLRTFGKSVDVSGKKAIRVKGLEGSRGEVDVVPAFVLHKIRGTLLSGYSTVVGTAILSKDGNWTHNFPEQHIANGRAKRLRTGLQFKRVVRIVKRLRTDMAERGLYTTKVPSFLIECLVYLVEDEYFTVQGDDRYGRTQRILRRLDAILKNSLSPIWLREINGVKLLFGSEQAWTYSTATSFVAAALVHLGGA
ncbi:hypothetical protein [Bradyrhizobium sp. HKCCYLR20261]|uniref:hypothetical protein n=1 Tax=Bradyrhizobium sp. HKCCYLR20261 TaxID=3420760 RepID=UPI003EB96FC2